MLKQLEAKYTLFDNVEKMLAPETLSDLLQYKVSQVACQPFDSSDSYSGSQLYNVTAEDKPLIMKRLKPSFDWKSIASDDHRCRSVRLWQYGFLDRIQPHMDHATLAACRDGDDYAILMHDVSHGLFYGKEITTKTIHTLLNALAAMHAIFWGDETLKAPELGLCHVEKLIKYGWSSNWDGYRHDAKTFSKITQGWGALFELVDPDVRDALQSLMERPQPLLDRLGDFPSTFIHGDYRTGNLALLPETNQLVAFDWQDASYAPATICLSWFIMTSEVFMMQDTAAEYYRQRLSIHLNHQFDQDLWHPMLEVGCLVDVLRKGSWHALFAISHPDEAKRKLMRQSVTSYNDIVRKGLKWL